jgi:hypothetical protein
MTKKEESLKPFIITVVICAILIVLMQICTPKQPPLKTSEEIIAPVKAPHESQLLQQGEAIHPLEIKAQEAYHRHHLQEQAQDQKERIDDLVSAQHDAFLKRSKQQTAAESKYNLYPNQEQLEKMKDQQVLMY